MNINECGCRPYGWLGLDGNRCIRVIPRQKTPKILDKKTTGVPLQATNIFNERVLEGHFQYQTQANELPLFRKICLGGKCQCFWKKHPFEFNTASDRPCQSHRHSKCHTSRHVCSSQIQA